MINSFFCFALLIGTSSLSSAQNFPRVDADLKVYDDTVAAKENEFNKIPVDEKNIEWVKLKIAHLVDVDQYSRRYSEVVINHNYSAEEKTYFKTEFLKRMILVDEKDTADVKGLLKVYDWFKISIFGAATDNNAWLIVQHADRDPGFQKEVLTKLELLYPVKETSPKNYGYLFDRVAASWGDPSKRQLQRFGTQGNCNPQTKIWEPLPCEDPANLDKRRAEFGMEPMSEYIKLFKCL